MEQNSIVVKNVTKKFDDFMLDHISFTVPTGRIAVSYTHLTLPTT